MRWAALAIALPALVRALHAPMAGLATHRVNAPALHFPTAGFAAHRVSTPTMKETTLDRLTGPKLFKTVKRTEGIHAVPLVPLRILTGVLMIHHGSEGGFWPANFGTPAFDGFVDFIIKQKFAFLPGDPALWSAIHDYVEFWGGILFAVGLLTRPAALSLLVTMAAAVYFHLSDTGWQGFPFGHVDNYSYAPLDAFDLAH